MTASLPPEGADDVSRIEGDPAQHLDPSAYTKQIPYVRPPMHEQTFVPRLL